MGLSNLGVILLYKKINFFMGEQTTSIEELGNDYTNPFIIGGIALSVIIILICFLVMVDFFNPNW